MEKKMTKIYTYKNCSTCKHALRFLDNNKIDYINVPIRETPPSIDELSTMLTNYENNIKSLFNRSGKDYRELNLKDKLDSMSVKDCLTLLNQNGNLVKRPFLLSKKGNIVGFNEELWKKSLLK